MAEPKRPVLWSADARADLDAIWAYYVKVAGPSTAKNIVEEINKASDLIGQFPLAGRIRDEVAAGLRSIAVAPHVVFFTESIMRYRKLFACWTDVRILTKFFRTATCSEPESFPRLACYVP